MYAISDTILQSDIQDCYRGWFEELGYPELTCEELEDEQYQSFGANLYRLLLLCILDIRNNSLASCSV